MRREETFVGVPIRTPEGVEHVPRERREECVDVLYHAFGGVGGLPEMMIDWIVGQEIKGSAPLFESLPLGKDGAYHDTPEREEVLRYFMEWSVELCFRYGVVFAVRSAETPERYGAVMACLPPRFHLYWWRRMSMMMSLGFPPWTKYKADKWTGVKERFEVFEKAIHTKEKEVAKEPHIKVFVLGVDPLHQGKGFSSRLLRYMNSIADAQGTDLYLECSSGRNEAMYKHFGYTTKQKAVMEAPPNATHFGNPFDMDGGGTFMVRSPKGKLEQ